MQALGLRIIAYVASKLAAAGLVFLGFLAIMAEFQLYEMSQLAWELPLWKYIYGYAVLFSVVVDAMLYKLKAGPSKIALTVLFYILGGYVPFLFWFPGQWLLSLYAGVFGVACAFAFLAVSYLFRRLQLYSAAAALLLLAGSIYISTTDFTVTEQWRETRTTDSYQAEFAYFNGQKGIPVELEKGQTLSYNIDWQITSGGYGTHLDAKGGTHTSAEQDGDAWFISYRVDTPSTVRIIVTGDQAQGALKVKWEISG